MVSGPSTVIQAVASAREAVTAIDALLSGGKAASKTVKGEDYFTDSTLDTTPRVRAHPRPASERIRGIDVEDVPGLAADEIELEARRCFNCGCLAVGPSDVAIALVALGASIVTTKRTVGADRFFSASATRSTVLEPDELIKEILIPKPPAGARQKYDKFTLRTPIDFALVSVASVFTVKGGICEDARIVLGAVAPEPLRAYQAEEAMKGRPVDEKSAAEAAEAAVAGAIPLSMNEYKAEITKALVKRAILGP
jgi:hypothetical protein